MLFEEFRVSWISERNAFSNFESLCHCDASHQVTAQSDRVWEEMSLNNHLGYRNGRILAILNFHVATMPGGHLGYGNRTILAILSLYNSQKPPIVFQLNLTDCLGLDVVWRVSRWQPWRPSWISDRKDFSNSESLCHCDASYQVLAQSNFRFGRRYCLKNFGRLGYRNGTSLAILNLCVTVMPPIKLQLNRTGFGRRCRLKNFRMAAMAATLDIGTEGF